MSIRTFLTVLMAFLPMPALAQSGVDISRAAGKVKHIIGHRGSCADRPENTLASYRRAIEAGATMMEMDVRSTKDGALISLHDTDLKRTTNGKGLAENCTPRPRYVPSTPARGSILPIRTTRVPTLREILELGKGKIDVLLDLQATGENYTDEYARPHRRRGAAIRRSERHLARRRRSLENAKRFRKILPEAKQIGLIPTADSIDAFADAKVDIIRLWPKWLTDKTLVPAAVRASGLLLHLNGTVGRPKTRHACSSRTSPIPSPATTPPNWCER